MSAGIGTIDDEHTILVILQTVNMRVQSAENSCIDCGSMGGNEVRSRCCSTQLSLSRYEI